MRNAFTLIEFLIALVIIGFIVAILVGVFSSPVKQARTDSAVTQIKDGLRQRNEAAGLLYAQGKCADGGACMSNLVALGGLTAEPSIPTGIDGANPASWSGHDQAPGGCGPDNIGAATTESATIRDVSDEFCKAYNNSQGLGSVFVDSCAVTPAGCVASGSTNQFDWPVTNATSFCVKHDAPDNSNFIVMPASVPQGECS